MVALSCKWNLQAVLMRMVDGRPGSTLEDGWWPCRFSLQCAAGRRRRKDLQWWAWHTVYLMQGCFCVGRHNYRRIILFKGMKRDWKWVCNYFIWRNLITLEFFLVFPLGQCCKQYIVLQKLKISKIVSEF